MTDEALLAAYRADGDNKWLGALLQRYTALLLGVAMKYLGDRTLAEDAVQHVFETTLTHLPDEPVQNFKGWLYVLMRNHCLQVLRKRGNQRLAELSENMVWDGGDAVEAEKLNYTLDQMNEALDALQTEQKTAISMFYMQRFSYEQIVARTGYTFMQVKSYIQNGKRNLRTILINKLREKGHEW